MRVGKREYNRLARVYQHNRVKKIINMGWNDQGYATGDNERCNNCKASYSQLLQSEAFPHYCAKCRNVLLGLWNCEVWDGGEGIPF